MEKKDFWSNVNIKTDDECWEWKLSKFPNGYGQIKYNNITMGAHRVAFELAKGKIDAEKFILHSCDNKSCCNPNHLRQGTHAENMIDSRERTHKRGKDHHNVKTPLSEEYRKKLSIAAIGKRKHSITLINEIRSFIKTNSIRKTAKQFDVTYSYVQRIGSNQI